MKKGLELLKVRKKNYTIDFNALEKKYNIKIPYLYKIFLENFSVGENSILCQMFYHPEFKDERYISYFTFSKKPEIDFSGFNSLENSIMYSKEIEDTDDIKYLTIGYCSVGGIMMDLNDETQGQIYYYEPDAHNNAYQKIADNIFDFVRNLKEVFESEEYLDGIKYSQLYKKWGEDFWRVRE